MVDRQMIAQLKMIYILLIKVSKLLSYFSRIILFLIILFILFGIDFVSSTEWDVVHCWLLTSIL